MRKENQRKYRKGRIRQEAKKREKLLREVDKKGGELECNGKEKRKNVRE